MSIKTGIVGYGKSARFIHSPLIKAAEGMELCGVVQRRGDEASNDWPGVKIYRSFKEIVKDEAIDLFIITTPNHLHFKMAMEALNAGKHVVVEKPFTVTSEEAYKLIKLAGQSGLKLTVFHNRRWDGDILTVHKLVERNAVGRIIEVESRFDRFRKYLREDAWKEKDLPGSGILYDLGPHLIDQAVQLFGNPRTIYADIRSQRGGEADDYFDIDFRYENLKVKLKAGMLVADETPRFIVRGTDGAFVKYGMDPQEEALSGGKSPAAPDWGTESKERWGILNAVKDGEISEKVIETERGMYPEFYTKLVSAIDGEGEVPVAPGEAAEVIRLIELAVESSRKGKLIRLSG